MKMVKSLLLSGAAGLLAVAGAQAADLPVKAKPVQYVKICSLYGAGFYYMPGTNTCLKIGGWVRLQENYGVNGNSSNGAFGGASDTFNWRTQDYTTRVRGYITADAREQTEYGTLRSYIAVGTSGDNVAGSENASLSVNRAFIQFAGFTAGRAVSFFDSASTAALAYAAGAGANFAGGMTTGDAGHTVLAYTAQFGNGLSASISAENPRLNGISFTTGTTREYSGVKAPDLVANLRIDQAWGSAQIAGAVHEVGVDNGSATAPTTIHTSDTGWAISGGLKVNLPMLGHGDYFDSMVNYSEGAVGYTSAGANEGGTQGAYSILDYNVDAVTDAAGNIHLTKQFSVFAGYQHDWNAQWKTSLWGDYIKTSYDSAANLALGGVGYDGSWSGWQIGTRTAWFPVKNLEIGVEVYYTDLKAPTTTSPLTSSDMNAWAGQLRIQRNFYP